MYKTFGERKLTIARELTKLHEEIIRTTTKEAYEKFSDGSLKGEIVLILEGKTDVDEVEYTLSDAVKMAEKFISDGMRPTDAAKEAAKITKIRKNDIYKELV